MTNLDPSKAVNILHPDQKAVFKLSQRELEKGDRSFVWNYFHVVDGLIDDDKNNTKARALLREPWKKTTEYAICNCCGDQLKAQSDRGWTSGSMKPHLVNNHKITALVEEEQLKLEAGNNPKRKFKQDSLLNFMSKAGGNKIKSASELRDEQSAVAAVWLAETNQALSTVEESSFRNMISTFAPTAKALIARNVRERIIDIDCNIRKQSIAKMKGCSVNLTCDHCSSEQNLNYVGMTAHWIDVDFKMHSLPLGMFLHEGGSTVALLIDEYLANVAREVSTEATIFAVTTDTDPSMNTFGKLLEEGKNSALVL